MPRYFFDLDDGDEILIDTEGSEHEDLDAAQREAAETLSQIGREVLRGSKDRVLKLAIRSGTHVVSRSRLSYSVKTPRPR